MKEILVKIIDIYQTFFSFDRGMLSVFAPGGACRYSPSCSQYTKESIVQFGVFKGSKMGIARIWSCK